MDDDLELVMSALGAYRLLRQLSLDVPEQLPPGFDPMAFDIIPVRGDVGCSHACQPASQYQPSTNSQTSFSFCQYQFVSLSVPIFSTNLSVQYNR